MEGFSLVEELTARSYKMTPEMLIRNIFSNQIECLDIVDAVFADSSYKQAIGISGLQMKVPAVLEMLKDIEIACHISEQLGTDSSVLICIEDKDIKIYKSKQFAVAEISIPEQVHEKLTMLLSDVKSWAGRLNTDGEHEIDLFMPSPGPHFSVNLLMGNRIGYPYALQTTPKSVVDRFGGGSFRSHAATQVLASRWDMRQEENGFPANRQFYLVENNKKIFYSAEINRSNIVSATCRHSQNYTTIKYNSCGLDISRLIFILPQAEGMPIATEVQRIGITNNTAETRRLRIVYTGMFGSSVPNALFEDVLYSNIVMQSKLLRNNDGEAIAVATDYYAEKCKKDLQFHTMLTHNNGEVRFIKEFCMNYNDFVGNGTLQNPDGILKLSNRLNRKGPGFFAVANEIIVEPGETCYVDQLTGIVSEKTNPHFNEASLQKELLKLISEYSKPEAVNKAFEQNKSFLREYSEFLQVQTQNEDFNTYVNKNLPFQVLYQTFVSRSFCQTQKGYREIGFREIQDIYASMYYFINMGMGNFVKQLLLEWCSMIFEFGYAYHNFFWEGKEAGKWSDDQLWFVQAVDKYINLTGDVGLLDQECTIAGTFPQKKRTVYETIKALIQYSAKISIGKHGLPLLDYADWNDCLKLDSDFIDGITKEKKYRQQISEQGNFGDALKSDYSESVMNAFLLKLAIVETMSMAKEKQDINYLQELEVLRDNLQENIQKHAWKGDFFARVLFNRYKANEYEYLGAGGDKLSADPNIDGSYFLNSFSWSILSDCASENQIRTMLDVIELRLKTNFGLKLVTPTDLGKVSTNTATAEYFPGDRENGGVFKHACMMAVQAMFKAAKQVQDSELATKLSSMGYWLIDIVEPYRTMENPFVICGNPRFCTQYNNSETGENIGPMLSGTSSWLTLALVAALGIEYNRKGLTIDPVMRVNERLVSYTLRMPETVYKVRIEKPEGFYRVRNNDVKILFDGVQLKSNTMQILKDNKEHNVVIIME